MDPLYLDVKYGVWIHFHSVLFLDICRQPALVFVFYLLQLLQEVLIILVFQQFFQLVSILLPIFADMVCDQLSQLRISFDQESSVADAVSLVVELFRCQLIEFLEHILLQDIAVDGCNAIYRMASDDGHIGHLRLTVPQDRCCLQEFLTSFHVAVNAFSVTSVYLFDDHIDSRQQPFHKIYRPSFQRLRHYRMICERNCFCGDIPGFVPLQTFLVHKHSHQFRYAKRRVCVIDMDSYFIREIRPVISS